MADSSFMRHFAALPDPRGRRGRLHKLHDIIVISVLAFICGADDWTEVAVFGRSKGRWLRTFLGLPWGVPSHDTFGDLFARLDPDAFEACFTARSRSLVGRLGGKLVAVDGDHGRIETRRVWVTNDLGWLGERHDWPGLRSVAVAESARDVPLKGVTAETRFYISSLADPGAAEVAGRVRGHWSVENQLHWQLDVSFGEDQSRARKGHAAENQSRLRRLALMRLKQDTRIKAGIKAKRKAAGWDHDYLLTLLTG